MSTHYWDTVPCNVNHSPAAIGSEQWSNEVTERKYKVEPHIPAFADFPKWKGQRVLEVGCGIGTDTLEFARAGARIDAVDTSLVSLNLASIRCADYPVRFLKDIPIEQYHLIYSFGVLHHMENPQQALYDWYPRVALGGQLRIMVYARWSWKFLTNQQPEAQEGCPIVHTYTKREIREMVEKAGFKVISIQKRHIFPYRLKDYLQYRYKRTLLSYLLPEKLLGHHLLVKAVKP